MLLNARKRSVIPLSCRNVSSQAWRLFSMKPAGGRGLRIERMAADDSGDAGAVRAAVHGERFIVGHRSSGCQCAGGRGHECSLVRVGTGQQTIFDWTVSRRRFSAAGYAPLDLRTTSLAGNIMLSAG